jgi:hypothetical protein
MAVAERFGLSVSGVGRHKRRHLVVLTAGGAVTAELKAMDVANPRERLEILLHTTLSTLTSAMKSGSSTGANAATREIRGILAELAKAETDDRYPRSRAVLDPTTDMDLVGLFMSFVPNDVHEAFADHRIPSTTAGATLSTMEKLRDLLNALIANPSNWTPGGRMVYYRNLRITDASA